MLLNEFQYLPCDARVGTDVTMVHFPIAHLYYLCVLEWHDANSDLRGLAEVRTVERNRRHRPAPHAFPGFLVQPLERPIFQHHIDCSLSLSPHSVVVSPPSTAISWPVMYEPASEASRTAIPASSRGLPQRRNATRLFTNATKSAFSSSGTVSSVSK